MEPRVSFIVPSYNYGRFVAQAIDSLLAQTFQELEVIAIDDASPDDTAEVLARYAGNPCVRVILHKQNRGHIRSYNEGLALARGEYVGILSADDYCVARDAVARQVAIFDEHPRVGMVYSAHTMVEPGEQVTPVIPWPRDGVRSGSDEFRSLMWGNYVLHSGTLLRRAVQAELGPYDPSLPQCGDWDMWLRTAARHDIGYIAEPLYAYRIHRKNMQGSGIPPRQQAEQNVRTLERGFAALPAAVPDDIRASRGGALNHALLQTAWFDLFNGRRLRACQGLAYAATRRPSLVLHAEVWQFTARLVILMALGKDRYRRAMHWLERQRGRVMLPTP